MVSWWGRTVVGMRVDMRGGMAALAWLMVVMAFVVAVCVAVRHMI